MQITHVPKLNSDNQKMTVLHLTLQPVGCKKTENSSGTFKSSITFQIVQNFRHVWGISERVTYQLWQMYRLIDTAGIRRRTAVASAGSRSEYLSINRAFRAIRRSDVVALVIDAMQCVTEQVRLFLVLPFTHCKKSVVFARLLGFHDILHMRLLYLNKWCCLECQSFSLRLRIVHS